MNKYYIIENSTEREIGSTFPQLHCTTQPYAHQISHWEFPKFKPKLEFELEYKAKLTDVLSDGSISGTGFLVNSKLKKLFDQFNIMKHKFYDAKVINPKNKKSYLYYWMHLCEPELTMHLNYTKSTFFETLWTFREKEITIDSLQHYKKLKAKDKEAKFGVEVEEIFLSNQFDKTLDMFTFLPFADDIFISEKLYKELLQNHITGFELKESNLIKF